MDRRTLLLSSTSLLALASCQTTGITNAQILQIAQNAQGLILGACGLMVPAEEIAALMTANPALITATAVAKIICAAIAVVPGPTTGPAKMAARPMRVGETRAFTVKGVTIHATKVRKP